MTTNHNNKILPSQQRNSAQKQTGIHSRILSICGFLGTTMLQSWARAFFYASRLRFRALGRGSSRWRFRALFWALNFALLCSRFRAPALLDFSRSFFALLDFSRFFHAPRFFALVHLRSSIFALVISCSCVYTRP